MVKKKKKSTAELAEEELNNLSSGPGNDSVGLITIPTATGDIKIDYGGDADKEIKAAMALQNSGVIASSAPVPVQPAIPPGIQSKKLSEIIEEFKRDRKYDERWKHKTEKEYDSTFHLLIEYFGDVESVTISASQARKFRETLLKIPLNSKKGKYKGKTISQMIAMKPERVKSKTTINNNYLTRYSALFSWAVTHEHCAINPFKNLKFRIKKKAVDDRDPFLDSDLEQIFDKTHYPDKNGNDPWKYWMPLMGLLTGARVNELAQLRVCDIVDEDGIYGLRLTEDAGSLKNLSSKRVLPLHPLILKFGFLDYLDGVQKRGKERLFPELHGTSKGPGDKVSRWFNNTYLRKCGLRPTVRKISYHSFRHTFVNFYKKQDMFGPKAKQLTGHSVEEDMGGRYGDKFNLKESYELLIRLDIYNWIEI